MKLTEILSPASVSLDLKASHKEEALQELCGLLEGTQKVSDRAALLKTLIDREALGSTGIGQGVAIPHGKCPAVTGQAAALGISKEGVDFEALDGEPVHILFLLVAPPDAAGLHLKALARISRLLKDRAFRQSLRDARTAEDILVLLRKEDDL